MAEAYIHITTDNPDCCSLGDIIRGVQTGLTYEVIGIEERGSVWRITLELKEIKNIED